MQWRGLNTLYIWRNLRRKEGVIPEEWVQNWWCAKLDKVPVGKVSIERMLPQPQSEEEEDLYG